MPALIKSSPKSFTKDVISEGYGFHTPQDGSVCHIKVISDDQNVMGDLKEDRIKEIIIGDVDEPIELIIEDCVRTMKEEEICSLNFVHPCFFANIEVIDDKLKAELGQVGSEIAGNKSVPKDEDKSEEAEENMEKVPDPSSIEESLIEPQLADESKETDVVDKLQIEQSNTEALPNNQIPEISLITVQLQLLDYTREPEIWEMSITEKWRRASYHKQKGLELYSRGEYQYAFRRFGLTLKYVISLEHDVPSGQEEGMDIKGLKLSCYLNVAACQMRHHNYDSVVTNSSKALTLQPDNAKALYRRGSAYLQLQEFEKAKEDLTAAQVLEPKNQAVAKQLQLLKNQVQKLNQYYASAMKKLFS